MSWDSHIIGQDSQSQFTVEGVAGQDILRGVKRGMDLGGDGQLGLGHRCTKAGCVAC